MTAGGSPGVARPSGRRLAATATGGDTFADRVVEVVTGTHPGEVLTYGEVAVEAGAPGAARPVGRVLSASGGSLPWWRVVRADGRLVPGLEAEQAALLAREGIESREGRLRRPRPSVAAPPLE